MKPFEEFWEDLLKALETSPEVRNWTAKQGYLGGKFWAIPYRCLSSSPNVRLSIAFITGNPSDSILCTRVSMEERKTLAVVSKKDFRDRYHKWASYSKRGM